MDRREVIRGFETDDVASKHDNIDEEFVETSELDDDEEYVVDDDDDDEGNLGDRIGDNDTEGKFEVISSRLDMLANLADDVEVAYDCLKLKATVDRRYLGK